MTNHHTTLVNHTLGTYGCRKIHQLMVFYDHPVEVFRETFLASIDLVQAPCSLCDRGQIFQSGSKVNFITSHLCSVFLLSFGGCQLQKKSILRSPSMNGGMQPCRKTLQTAREMTFHKFMFGLSACIFICVFNGLVICAPIT